MKDKERAKRYAKRMQPKYGHPDLPRYVNPDAIRIDAYLAGLRMGRKLEREAK